MNKLKVINFKSISEMEIEPAGKSFTLTGKNGAGKTAVIDAVRWALQGNAFISNDVIKQGENEVKVLYEDDQFSITRSMKRGKTASDTELVKQLKKEGFKAIRVIVEAEEAGNDTV